MSFALDLKRFREKFKEGMDDFVAGIEIKLFSSVILNTPVGNPDEWVVYKKNPHWKRPKDYVGGRARANWQVSLNQPENGVLPDIDPDGQQTVGKVTSFVTGQSGGRLTFLVNNLAYASRLELGHSKQAPHGMVRVNVTRFQQLVKEEAQKL